MAFLLSLLKLSHSKLVFPQHGATELFSGETQGSIFKGTAQFYVIRVQEGWIYLKKEILQAQEQAIPRCPKRSHQGGSLAWLHRELLLELEEKIRVYDLGK